MKRWPHSNSPISDYQGHHSHSVEKKFLSQDIQDSRFKIILNVIFICTSVHKKKKMRLHSPGINIDEYNAKWIFLNNKNTIIKTNTGYFLSLVGGGMTTGSFNYPAELVILHCHIVPEVPNSWDEAVFQERFHSSSVEVLGGEACLFQQAERVKQQVNFLTMVVVLVLKIRSSARWTPRNLVELTLSTLVPLMVRGRWQLWPSPLKSIPISFVLSVLRMR